MDFFEPISLDRLLESQEAQLQKKKLANKETNTRAFSDALQESKAPERSSGKSAAAKAPDKDAVLARFGIAARPSFDPDSKFVTSTYEQRLAHIEEQKAEIRKTGELLHKTDGYSKLEGWLEKKEKQVLGDSGGPIKNDEMTLQEREMALNHHLNLQYLALQDKLGHGHIGLLSNLMKARHDSVKETMSRNY